MRIATGTNSTFLRRSPSWFSFCTFYSGRSSTCNGRTGISFAVYTSYSSPSRPSATATWCLSTRSTSWRRPCTFSSDCLSFQWSCTLSQTSWPTYRRRGVSPTVTIRQRTSTRNGCRGRASKADTSYWPWVNVGLLRATHATHASSSAPRLAEFTCPFRFIILIRRFAICGRRIEFSFYTFSGLVLLLSLLVSPSCLFLYHQSTSVSVFLSFGVLSLPAPKFSLLHLLQ